MASNELALRTRSTRGTAAKLDSALPLQTSVPFEVMRMIILESFDDKRTLVSSALECFKLPDRSCTKKASRWRRRASTRIQNYPWTHLEGDCDGAAAVLTSSCPLAVRDARVDSLASAFVWLALQSVLACSCTRPRDQTSTVVLGSRDFGRPAGRMEDFHPLDHAQRILSCPILPHHFPFLYIICTS